MARTETNGLSTVLQLLGDVLGTEAGKSSGGQDDFFEADAPLPLREARGVSGPQGGRPKGARNKSTDAWVAFHLARYRSPMTQLAEIAAQDTGDLVDKLQAMADKHKSWVETKEGGRWERVAIDPLAVLKLQRDAAAALLPYIHKQQPKAIEVEQQRRGVMLLDLGVEDAQTVSSDDVGLSLAPLEEKQ